MEMSDKVMDAKEDAKEAMRKASTSHTLASNHLRLLNELKVQVSDLKDNLVKESKMRDSLEKMKDIRLQIKRERKVGRKGGASQWPVHIVMLICELLTNGTPPSAVPANLQTMSAAMNGCEASKLPCLDFVRRCRTVAQNLNTMLAIMRSGKANKWNQIFTDGTTRRQIAFQNLVIGIEEDTGFDSVIASSCIFVQNESAAKLCEVVIFRLFNKTTFFGPEAVESLSRTLASKLFPKLIPILFDNDFPGTPNKLFW